MFDAERNHLNVAWLTAVPEPDRILRLRKKLNKLRRRPTQSRWQIFTGQPWMDGQIERDLSLNWNDLVLDAQVRQRMETEVSSFFSPAVAKLHRDIGVPYRRGVLLHGPPGNGKTSIVRVVAAHNARIPGVLLRPGGSFDESDFLRAMEAWRSQAPCMLVIEDLDWLLPKVSVSTFLNAIDGVERQDAGMLLIATTNHPQALDPAISNRPGRFDVVVEVPAPTLAHRLQYLHGSLLGQQPQLPLESIARQTSGVSYSHLREIINLSGLMALRQQRISRSEQDVLEATQVVIKSFEAANRGFPQSTQMPFGLRPGRQMNS